MKSVGPATPRPLTDSEKLLVLAAWFDMWDRPETDRQAILDDDRNPGKNDVQADLRRIAFALDAGPRDEDGLLREARLHIRHADFCGAEWVGENTSPHCICGATEVIVKVDAALLHEPVSGEAAE